MTTSALTEPTATTLSVSKLDFDEENPRFPKEIAEAAEEVLIERFIRDERLQEIVESIGDQGYFPGEPLLVVRAGTRFTVVEGNRRLAALKLLNGLADPPKGRIAIEKAVENAQYKPDRVQCLVFNDAKDIVKYLGFRHITGIKPWNALQKARYMQRLLKMSKRRPTPTTLRQLARETGSTASYLGQSLTALTLYEAAEEKNFYKLGLSPSDIEFSLLTTALSYSNIAEYVGLDDGRSVEGDPNPIALRNLFNWLFVAQENQKPIVRESRQLKKLAAVVSEKDAVADLLKNGNLDEAFELSKGTAVALSESLTLVHRRIKKAWEWLPKVSSENLDLSHEELSGEIVERSTDVHDYIASKRKPATKRIRRRAL